MLIKKKFYVILKDIDVLKCLVYETAAPLAPKAVMELICIIKTMIAPLSHG